MKEEQMMQETHDKKNLQHKIYYLICRNKINVYWSCHVEIKCMAEATLVYLGYREPTQTSGAKHTVD